jgi:hypothetical protein
MLQMFKSKLPLIGGALLLLCLLGMFLLPSGPDHTPSQVVQQFIKVYPKDLISAATITSWGMRDGLAPEEWVTRIQTTLGDFQFLSGQVVSETIHDEKAEVLIDAKISSALGEQVQREQYQLSIVDNKWIIDHRAVVMVFPAPPTFF